MNSAFHPEAREEFLAAVDFYNESVPGLGGAFAAEVRAAVELIEAFPKTWPEVAYEIHRCLVNRFPYALLYAVEKDLVMIYAVMHTKRNPDYWKNRPAHP